MYLPRTHGGWVTIDAAENIVMHDTLREAGEFAAGDPTCWIYEAHFTPITDLLEDPQPVRPTLRLLA